MTIQLTFSALLRRINRRLAHDNERLCKTRQDGELRREFGAFYVKDEARNRVVLWNVDPEAFGRELGVLGPDETLIDPESED